MGEGLGYNYAFSDVAVLYLPVKLSEFPFCLFVEIQPLSKIKYIFQVNCIFLVEYVYLKKYIFLSNTICYSWTINTPSLSQYYTSHNVCMFPLKQMYIFL